MPVLEIANLSVQLGPRRALDEVSLRVESGQFCAVIGPNGSGKSTLLRAVSGLVAPLSGSMRWNGAPLPARREERAKLVALLPQSSAGGDEMFVDEMAMLGRTPHLTAYGASSTKDRAVVDALLNRVAPDLRGRRLGELSGGQRQRAMLCRALATQAPVLLLDEPISALDIRFQHEILDLVRSLTRELQLATICVLHGINLAALVADSMVLLNSGGQIEASGTPLEVMTGEHLTRVYGVEMRTAPHPLSGKPQAQGFYSFDDPN